MSSDGYSDARLRSRHEALTSLEEPRQLLAFTLIHDPVWPESGIERSSELYQRYSVQRERSGRCEAVDGTASRGEPSYARRPPYIEPTHPRVIGVVGNGAADRDRRCDVQARKPIKYRFRSRMPPERPSAQFRGPFRMLLALDDASVAMA